MSIGYMGNTNICCEFVTTNLSQHKAVDCSSCSAVIPIDNKSNLVLVVDISGSTTLQCIECYAKAVGANMQYQTSQMTTCLAPTTPSAPRARNTSDVSESGSAVDAANAVSIIASFSDFMLQHEHEQHSLTQTQTSLQASPAMLLCDGIYHSN